MLTDTFALNIAARLNSCTTVTEQGAFLSQVFATIRKETRIATAEELAGEMVKSRFSENMPMATWPYAERYASSICKRYAQNLQSDTDKTPDESAEFVKYEVGAAVVTRDARGFWRHPLYPVFRPDEPESRSEWFKENGLDGCGTFLVSPEEFDGTTSGNDNCSAWEVVRPAGGKWFLLAIESTSSGPVALWAAKVGA